MILGFFFFSSTCHCFSNASVFCALSMLCDAAKMSSSLSSRFKPVLNNGFNHLKIFFLCLFVRNPRKLFNIGHDLKVFKLLKDFSKNRIFKGEFTIVIKSVKEE